MIKVIYVSGTRADFGLMQHALQQLHADDMINLSVCVTAMHLDENYGNTVQDIEESGLTICERISVELDQSSTLVMSKAIGHQINAMSDCFAREKPDLIILLGDRGEMMAAASAALHLEIPTLHLHGGEVSGHIDDHVRHAISMLSIYHCPATEISKARLIKMGIAEDKICVTGAPGLDALHDFKAISRADLARKHGFDPQRPVALMLFHPVHDEFDDMKRQTQDLFKAALSHKIQLICMLPNADAGGHFIRDEMLNHQDHADVFVQAHLSRRDFLSFMHEADVMIGNSSAGIIESASFGTPVLNIGNRQNNRERNANVVDVDANESGISAGLDKILRGPSFPKENLYGDGHAGSKLLGFIHANFGKGK